METDVDRLRRACTWRLLLLAGVFSLVPLMLAGRLWSIQVTQTATYKAQISKQTFRRIRLAPVRGRIFAADGALLADNEPSHDAYLHVHEMRQRPVSSYRATRDHLREVRSQLERTVGRAVAVTDTQLLAAIGTRSSGELTFYRTLSPENVARLRQSGLPDGFRIARQLGAVTLVCSLTECRVPGKGARQATADYIYATVQDIGSLIERVPTVGIREITRHMRVRPALRLPIFRNLVDHELAVLQEQMPGIAGLDLNTGLGRVYPERDLASHLLGWVGRRDPATESERNEFNYWLPELHGRAGLEAAFDDQLGGQGGMEFVKVDSTGFFYESVGKDPAQRGADLHLTIDSRAQRIAQSQLSGLRGALVAMDVDSGAVLACVSAPGFDLMGLQRESGYGEILAAPGTPLRNRAVHADYAPGSIVKPLVALCALDHGVIDPATEFPCPGYYAFGDGSRISCAVKSGHGSLTVSQALERSCNPFFIETGLKLGVDRLEATMREANIGELPGLEVSRRWSRGRRPSRTALKRQLDRNWRAFDTALVSMGQGFINTSPLQATVVTAAIANGGHVLKPRLVEALRDDKGPIEIWPRQFTGKIDAAPEHFALIREAMRSVVVGAAATAPSARSEIVQIAGKTGTAEIGPRDARRKNTWFTCFAPYDRPRYAVTVLVEDGQSGGGTAAPIARKFLEEFLQLQRAELAAD